MVNATDKNGGTEILHSGIIITLALSATFVFTASICHQSVNVPELCVARLNF